jgi:hypothetical protein
VLGEVKDEVEGVEILRKQVTASKEKMMTMLEDTILNEVRALLSLPLPEHARQQFRDIITTAVDVTTKLHLQRGRLGWVSRPHLPAAFDSSSQLMEAHTWHHRELDDDEKCLDGKPVLMVTQPAIVIAGASDGSDTKIRRVLRKAVVWMGRPREEVAEPDELHGATTTTTKVKIKHEVIEL